MTQTRAHTLLLRRKRFLYVASILLLAICATPTAAEDLLALPEGEVMGVAIDDNGKAWIAIQSLEGGETRLTLWHGDQSQILTLDTKNVKYAHPLSDSHLVIWDCLPLFEGDNHCDFSYRLYGVTGSGALQFHGEWDPARYPHPNIVFSADASMWGATTYQFDDSTRLAVGRHFTFGTTAPTRTERKGTVAFYPAKAERSSTDYDDNNFIVLDTSGPIVLVPYGEHLHLLRFGNSSVDRLQPEQLRSARPYTGSRGIWPGHDTIWQMEELLLWVLDGDAGAWLAYDLSRLRTEWAFPIESSLRGEGGGRPHPRRGYTRIISEPDRYRLEHVWQSPFPERTPVRHTSDWLEGPAPEYTWPPPLHSDEPAISGNGRHALLIEEHPSESARGTRRTFARRLALSPALSEAANVRSQE
ncbi:MAG: hypothetical protein F4112_03070 [Holophagales bacterium]|nr:hypothetical protein [Holophagales bacterium]MYD21867.1 hypothetical protein [Holophagales bacterium]MYI31936.1 hypothetical protein [Holophagales bacterium]